MPRKHHLNLFTIAEQTMIANGFNVTFPHEEYRESPDTEGIRDLRNLLWSSIDDGKTRDLDQVEYAEEISQNESRLLIGIADVDAFVPRGSATDQHAAANCTSVYTGVKTFPMLPEELSTDLTSLVQNQDRLVIVTEMTVCDDGSVKSAKFYRARVLNHAKLSYEEVGAWLEGKSGPPKEFGEVKDLEEQIRLQAKISERLDDFRRKMGAIALGTIQSVPVTDESGKVIDLKVIESNDARDLIANFMVTANVQMAEFLEAQGGPSLRRVVREPKYWDRIVEIAEEVSEHLPAKPDSRALAEFLKRRKKADAVHFPDLSLAVVKSLGPGEYAVQVPGEPSAGHFGLAVQDYTHSTAPNRRYADLITQRLVKAALQKSQNSKDKDQSSNSTTYSVADLIQIADRCTDRENAARKVERKMRKVAAAVLLQDQIGHVYDGIVTGVSEKGTFARAITPPVDGRIMRGERGLRVGDKVRLRLLSTDPEHGFIDFGKA
jgi:VacB/RNase II family 3'-5' exoribonuclease